MLISALAQTNWLAGLLDDTVRPLDRHGIELVVKLPSHDYSGQSQILQLAHICKRKRPYVGGLIVTDQPEHVQNELAAFCNRTHNARCFPRSDLYPPGTAFVGCHAARLERGLRSG